MENNTLFLKPLSSDEVFKMNKQKTLYMSNLGRIYCLNKNFSIEYHNGEPHIVQNSIERKSHSIKDLKTKLFPNNLSMEQKIEYEYSNVDESSGLIDSLSKYIEVSDLFMSYLIDNMVTSNFEKAVSDFFSEYHCLMKEDLKNCLLKPVYNRYFNIPRIYHKKIRDNIRDKKMPKEVVLYDVPCRLENSELIIFNFLKINLRDYVANSDNEFNCIYLGETPFKKIRFKIKKDNVIITFTKN